MAKDTQPAVIGSSVKVLIPNVTKGDKVLTFKNDTPEARQKMAKELTEIRKQGSLLSLYRQNKLDQIYGYDDASHAWMLSQKKSKKNLLPVEPNDEVHVITPLAGG